MTDHLTIPAYAKINLTLDVLPRRTDGYHDIRSIMQTVALHDTLEIRRTPNVPGVTLNVTGNEAIGVPSDASNIVHRAAVRLQKIAAARGTLAGDRAGLHITLTKSIPAQAGLGGGSSNAAATLLAVSRMFGLSLSTARLTEIATTLGADVPFFLTGGTSLVEGMGERVTPLPPFDRDYRIVIVKPPVGVSTAGAYAALDGLPERVPGSATEAWVNSDSTGRLMPPGNDFQEVVLAAYPQIAIAYDAMESESRTGWGPLLSGSGSAIFCLTQGERAAHLLADYLLGVRVGQVWVTRMQGRDE